MSPISLSPDRPCDGSPDVTRAAGRGPARPWPPPPDATMPARPFPVPPMSLLTRRPSVPVRIGPVTVGGGQPVVVQSMTNTDTADVEATALQVRALAHRRLRAGARHGEHGRSGRRGARDRRPARAARRDRADRRRLPLQRPQAAARASRLRRGAGQVPHQPGQRRPRQQARPAVRRDDRDRLPPRQAGAHRRELGQPRPGPADAADGRELAPPGPARRQRRDARGDRGLGARERAHAPRNSACPTTAS